MNQLSLNKATQNIVSSETVVTDYITHGCYKQRTGRRRNMERSSKLWFFFLFVSMSGNSWSLIKFKCLLCQNLFGKVCHWTLFQKSKKKQNSSNLNLSIMLAYPSTFLRLYFKMCMKMHWWKLSYCNIYLTAFPRNDLSCFWHFKQMQCLLRK